jgi:hypothetical protein
VASLLARPEFAERGVEGAFLGIDETLKIERVISHFS